LRSEIFKFLLGVVLMLVVSALLAFNALLLWVATGPRSLAVVTPYIERALSSSDGSYDVKVGETRLIWSGWRHPVDIRLKSVTVLTREGQVFTKFPEIALGVDILYLPFGRIMPTSLSISAPLVNLVQNNDRSFGFGFEQADIVVPETVTAPTVPFSVLLAPFLSQSEGSNFRRLHTIIIHDAGLTVSNSKRKVFFDAKDFNLILNRNRQGEIKINSAANIHYKDNISSMDYSSNIRTEFSFKPHEETIDGKNDIKGALEFSELRPDILAGLFSDNPDVKSFAVPISGKTNLLLDMDGIVQRLDFDINGSKGSLVSDRLIAPLPIDSLQFQGAFTNNFAEAQVESLTVDIDGIKLTASAMAKFFDTSLNSSATPEISADILLKDIPSNKAGVIWPPALSPMTREWVTNSISDGKISEAKTFY
jgi:hypothetical protein